MKTNTFLDIQKEKAQDSFNYFFMIMLSKIFKVFVIFTCFLVINQIIDTLIINIITLILTIYTLFRIINIINYYKYLLNDIKNTFNNVQFTYIFDSDALKNNFIRREVKYERD